MGVTKRARSRSWARAAATGAAIVFPSVVLVPIHEASAQPRTVADAMTVTPGRCLESNALASRVTQLRGADAAVPPIRLTVEESATSVRIDVRSEVGAGGERTLDLVDRDCREVREATALAVASAFDGTLFGEPPPPPPAPVAKPPIVLDAPPPQPPPVVFPAVEPRASGVRVGAAVEIGALLAVVPGVAFGVAPAVDLSITDFFDLRGSALISTTTTVDLETANGTKAGEADTGLVAGRLDGCLVTRDLAVRIRGCGGVAVGVMRAKGVDLVEATSDTAPWAAGSLRVDARYAIAGGFGLGLAVEGLVPFARPTLAASEADDAASAELTPVGGALLAGPFYRF